MALVVRGGETAAVYGDHGPEFQVYQGCFAAFVALAGGLEEFLVLGGILVDAEHLSVHLALVVSGGKALAVEGGVEGVHHLLGYRRTVNGLAVHLGHGGHVLRPLHPALQLQRGHAHGLNVLDVLHQAVVLQAQGVFVLPAGVAVALAAGLGAAAPVAGPGADHGGKIALAGIAHTQCAVAEDLDFNGGVGADIGNFLPVQLPAQHHPVHAHGCTHLHPGQGVHRQLGGAVDAHLGRDLAAQLHHAQVLDDEGVHARLGGSPDQLPDRLNFPVRHQGVQGQMDLHPPHVAIAQSLLQGVNGKVFGALAGVKRPHAQIDSIRPILHRCPQRIHRPRRGQQFQHSDPLHMVYL